MTRRAIIAVLSLQIGLFFSLRAQTTYYPTASDNHWKLDRLETRSGRLSDSLLLSARGESRKNAVQFLEQLTDTAGGAAKISLSRIDKYNIQQMVSESGEWAHDENGAIRSKHPWFRTFYKTQYDFVYIKKKDFFLSMNPVIYYVSGTDRNDKQLKGYPTNSFYRSSNLEFRGWIGKRLGYYIFIADNTERFPLYVYNYAVKDSTKNARVAPPGADYFNRVGDGNTFDYFLSSGYIDFAAIKDRVNITFGSGRHFYGDGLSSLFLTDFSGNMPFLRARARIWKLNYEVLYTQLVAQEKKGSDHINTKKFSTMHYITCNVTRWLNLGFFESVVFNRPNSYELSYLNPVALTMVINGYNGAGDKALIGFTGKAIIAKRLQLYGQLMYNEFRTEELFSNRGWYGNKWGIQAGAKYFDALGIRNLDLQSEIMAVRPYTYSAQDTLANYTNYNQPLADPLGAGFVKWTGLIRFQPFKNIVLQLKALTYVQGTDTGTANYGNDIFKPYLTAKEKYGVAMISGPRSSCSNISLNISWQVRRNLFLDFGSISRSYQNDLLAYPNYSTAGFARGALASNYVYFGVRLNSVRRDYSFF